jgi:hypothetical protein
VEESFSDGYSQITPATTTQSSSGSSLQATLPTLTHDLAPDQSSQPVQPITDFPKSQFGKVRCSFQPRWYQLHPWLEYSRMYDAAFCFACRMFGKSGAENSFAVGGFRDWKHATGSNGMLSVHLSTIHHKSSVLSWTDYNKRVQQRSTIGQQLDNIGARVINDNRQ